MAKKAAQEDGVAEGDVKVSSDQEQPLVEPSAQDILEGRADGRESWNGDKPCRGGV
ncbi:hypothetical protein PI125_g18690 [Phytophthora idaei]|nr:hypothetical protein PI125_g18690 [Phytophthora idaei]